MTYSISISSVLLVALLPLTYLSSGYGRTNAEEITPLDLSFDLARQLTDDSNLQKQFTASYGILPDREPPLTEIEIVLLKKMADMFRVNVTYAKTMLESLLTEDTQSSASFNYLLANLYYENEQYLLAEIEYKKAIEKHPAFQRAWTNLGVLKLRGDDYPAALEAFSKSIELGNISAATYGKLAFCHFMLGNYMSAEAAYTLAIMNDPGNRQWLEGKVEVYMESRRFEEAANMIAELINIDPDNPTYWLAHSNAELALDRIEEAARDIEVVNKLGQADADSLYQLGELYTSLRLNRLAVERFEAAVSKSPSQPQYDRVIEAALTMNSKGDINHASRLMELAQSQGSVDELSLSVFLRLKATLASQNGNDLEAIEAWKKLSALEPLNGEVLLKLVELYVKTGERDRAYLNVERALADERTRFQTLLVHAKLLVEDKRFQEALPKLAAALQIRSSDSLQNLYARVQLASEASL